MNDVSFLCRLPEGEVVKRFVVAVDLEILVPIEKNPDTGRQSRFQFPMTGSRKRSISLCLKRRGPGIHYQLGTL